MRIHLIAIGGSAMHNLALALQQNGHQVSGSDDEIYDPALSRLEKAGLLPGSFGWDPTRITKELDVVIVGMHARNDNPELQKATELGLHLHSYPSYLYEHARDKKRIVVGGSHGKTTTTALIMHVLQKSNNQFDYMVGAQLEGFHRMVQLSDAPSIVLEGDEYLSSPIDRRSKFLHYRPHLAILTGIAWDHINVFPTMESYIDTFRLFINSIEPGGKLFYYKHDAIIQKLVSEAPKHIICTAYEAVEKGPNKAGSVDIGEKEISWPLFGKHNRENLSAAWHVCESLGVDLTDFANAISTFPGPALRLELRHNTDGLVVFRDYAHAPSKVAATVKATKDRYPEERLSAIFELHTFSSLNKDFLPHYQGCLDPADEAVVFFIPHTLEMKKMPALDTEYVKQCFGREDLFVINSTEALEAWLQARKKGRGVFLQMSSGNFGKLGEWYK